MNGLLVSCELQEEFGEDLHARDKRTVDGLVNNLALRSP